MTDTIAECAENARQCRLYASKTKNAEEQKFLIRMAKGWTVLARKNAKCGTLHGLPCNGWTYRLVVYDRTVRKFLSKRTHFRCFHKDRIFRFRYSIHFDDIAREARSFVMW
jgi:hypothetical protein